MTRFLLALAFSAALAAEAHAASPLAVEAQHAMVVTSQHYASEVGVKILKEGATPSTRRSRSATRSQWSIPAAATSEVGAS